MLPDEICRRLGAVKVRSIFAELTTDTMKKVLKSADISTKSQTLSTKKRNEEWASKLWRAIDEQRPKADALSAIMLYEWLTRERRSMLATFLDGLGIAHQNGLTDVDIMTTADADKTRACAKDLLEKYDRAEVAAYLLFLDAQSKTDTFSALALDELLSTKTSALT